MQDKDEKIRTAVPHRYAKSDYLNDTEKKKLGYPFEDMLIDCKFEANTCSASEFEWYYDYNYGNCYRFNSGLS